LSLVVAGVSPSYAQEPSARFSEDCLRTPDRACVLDEVMRLVSLLDMTDRRQTLVAAVAQAWAQAGEIDRAVQLAAQVPDRLLARIGVLREIAAAQARAAHREQAEATFGEAMQLASGWKDALQRADALYAIARAEAATGMTAAADATYDQALQAAADVRIVGEKGRVSLPMPEWRLALLVRELAMRRAEMGDIARALQIARAIRYDSQTRAWTLLLLADKQMHAGSAAEATLDDALAAEHDARSGQAEWPSWRNVGIAVTQTPGNVRLLCDIAKAQVRAGLTAKAVTTFDEALRAAEATVTPTQVRGDVIVVGALTAVADAQREAGLTAAALETLDRAAVVAEAITNDRDRAHVLPLLAEMRMKAGDATPDLFVQSLAGARGLSDDHHRAHALQLTAVAQAHVGLRDEAAHTFAEAVSIVAQDGEMLGRIAVAQRSAGFIAEAAVTFEQALAVRLSGGEREKGDGPEKVNRVISLIHTIARDPALVAASPALRLRLVEAAEAITDQMTRADTLWIIARTLPN
jgi:tetratricopeptide (TPR) repeat protein